MSSELFKNCHPSFNFCIKDRLAIARAIVTLNGRSPKTIVAFFGEDSLANTAARNSPPKNKD